MTRCATVSCGLLWLLPYLTHTVPAAGQETAPTIVFDRDVEPILKRRCHACHGPDKSEGGLRLDLRPRALQGGDSGRAIRPGNANQSRLVALIRQTVPGERMPPEGALLTAKEIAAIARWIDQGAAWPSSQGGSRSVAEHWAYQPLKAISLPAVKQRQWPLVGVDRFILRRLERERAPPSQEATREIQIRRAHLDLTGLPPTPRQWRQWMHHARQDWYEQMVDGLLASPHFGERWGRRWLDLARYADTDGYEKDQPRPHAFHWRDWVLDAINRDLPFDQFSEQQLAGDLLPGATPETRLATGFHRQTLTNREGGIDKEEDRVKQAVDRVNTVATVWLGLTVKCAQCHSHKYDPISHREYYQLYAFFNNADETDFPLAATAAATARHQRQLASHAQRLDALRDEYQAARRRLTSELPALATGLLKRFPDGIEAPPSKGLQVRASFDDAANSDRGLAEAVWRGSAAPSRVAGKVGKALQLNGSSERWELGQAFRFDSDQPFTIGAWIQSANGGGAIVTKLDEAADFRGVDFTNNAGILEVHLVQTWPTDAIKVTTKSRVKNSEWHHALVRYDGSRKAAGVEIFVDGARQELTTHYDTLSGSIHIDEPLRIGSRKQGTFWRGRIDEVHLYDRRLDDQEIALLSQDAALKQFLDLARLSPQDRQPEQRASMIDYLVDQRPAPRKLRQQIAQLTAKPPQVERGTGMGLARVSSPRQTFVHRRGDFLDRGDEVQVGAPAFLAPLQPRGAVPDRLDLARWIIDPNNPLTARVAVNRVWQHYFGRGLVATSDDFGSQGDPPSHPELLDWLSVEFIAHNWEMKWLHRRLVTSATYRQSSQARRDLIGRDPYNRWLARQHRARIDAEMVRDAALATAGLLDTRTHGASVFPPLPPGILELAFVDVINRGPWKVSPGGDRYRRGLYTFYQRTSPYPMLALFDAPDSNTSCTRRARSNTPLQALMLWNDPVFLECARHLADRLLQAPHADDAQRITAAFVTTLSRRPDRSDRADIARLLSVSRKAFTADPRLADQLAGDTPARSEVSRVEWASWISVVRALMNLDEFITRE